MTESIRQENHWKERQSTIFDSFQPKAQRLIGSLYRKMIATKKRSFYLEKINEVVLDELSKAKSKQLGEDTG